MSCCKLPSIHAGQPRGSMKTIKGVKTYITFPSQLSDADINASHSWNRAILFLTDAYGPFLPNSPLLSDKLSQLLQCPVIMPDQYGEKVYPFEKPPDWDSDLEMARLQREHVPETVDPILATVLAWLQEPISAGGFGGVKHLGAIGYCFGGRYVIRLLAARDVEVGVINHPSFFTIKEVESIAQRMPDGALKETAWAPLAIFAAEDDDIFPEEKRRLTEDALKRGGSTWSCTTYSNTEHGFSTRGDLSIKTVRFARQAALRGAVEWFNEYLEMDSEKK